ncbi:helix-turn-helix domain-containing protein [Streptomyces achromogenes]|nr:helix-turn-helix domain-containing protein [Streptomyces achromogenes]
MPEQKRVPPQITDPTGRTVAANVRRHRERQGLSTYELARKLADAGRPIAASALSKIERGERRVDVGDLVALAVVLDVPPITLLMPSKAHGGVELTGTGGIDGGTGLVSGKRAWAWAQGREPLRYPSGLDEQGRARFLAVWLMAVTPEGPDFDMTTAEGRDAFIAALKAGAWGTEDRTGSDG